MSMKEMLAELGVPPVDPSTHPLAKVSWDPAELTAAIDERLRWVHERDEERTRRDNNVDPSIFDVRIGAVILISIEN